MMNMDERFLVLLDAVNELLEDAGREPVYFPDVPMPGNATEVNSADSEHHLRLCPKWTPEKCPSEMAQHIYAPDTRSIKELRLALHVAEAENERFEEQRETRELHAKTLCEIVKSLREQLDSKARVHSDAAEELRKARIDLAEARQERDAAQAENERLEEQNGRLQTRLETEARAARKAVQEWDKTQEELSEEHDRAAQAVAHIAKLARKIRTKDGVIAHLAIQLQDTNNTKEGES